MPSLALLLAHYWGQLLSWLKRNPVAVLFALSLLLNWALLELVCSYRDRFATIRAQQEQAAIQQAEANHEPARKSADIARISNAQSADYYARGRRDGAAYAAAHRVRNACPASNPDLPRTDHAAEFNDESGLSPGMVAVTQADFDTLTANSLRLAQVHQDAAALIAAGVAKSEDSK